MSPATEKSSSLNNESQEYPADNEYDSQNKFQIEAARKANNTWTFEGRELEMFVARGEAEVAVNVFDQAKTVETGVTLVHRFAWTAPDAFVIRENSFKTNLSRIGRRTEQKINTAHLATVNSEFYKSIIKSGKLRIPEVNGKADVNELTQDQMIEHANIYPEAVSEAIETWLDAADIARFDKIGSDFSFLFKVPDSVKILWVLGKREAPVAAGVFTFQAPSAEERAKYEESVQNIETKRRGDVSSTDIEENFLKKVQYGGKLLLDVEGIAVGEEGVKYDKALKEKFIVLFNPIWFGDVVDVMHSTFDFMKGRSKNN